jgi:hypothetical protein
MEARAKKFPAVNPLTQGDKPYFITDILASYNVSPSQIEPRLQKALECPVHLKTTELIPDRNIITILKNSRTLNSRTLYHELPAEIWPLTFPGTTAVIGKFIYRVGGNEVDCSKAAPGWMWMPPTDGIEKMTTNGALFILLVSNYHVLGDFAYDLFPQRFPCIVITAEGPPDFLIRMKRELNLPVLALLNTDPQSFRLLAFYGRRLKNFTWLGIRPTDIMTAYESSQLRVFPMNKKDIKIANSLLKDACINSRPEWLHELEIMLEKKQKIAIEYVAHLLRGIILCDR